MRGMIDIAPRASATDGDGPSRRIDTRVFHQSQVDYQTTIADSKASGVVSAAADCEKEIIFSGKIYRADYIRDIRAARYRAWLFVYHSIVHFPGFIVALIAWFDQSSSQVCL